MTNYQEFINSLFSMNTTSTIKYDPANCARLQALLDYPDRAFATLHIAGTNGKGSVCTKLAASLEACDYRVGLYTSPHLTCYRERIQINGKKISEEDVVALGDHILNIANQHDITTTFFEVTTLIALLYFKKEGVSWAVMETGLGGRLDATNVITPRACAITSISKDHTEILGKTEEAIAREKGGIIKEGVPIIIGPRVPESVIREIAEKKHAPLFRVDQTTEDTDEENRFVAEKVLQVIGVPIEKCHEALKKRPPGRFQIINDRLIIDVAHNPDAVERVLKKVKRLFPNQPIHLVFGLAKTKDAETCARIIKKHATSIHLVSDKFGKCLPAEELGSFFEECVVTPSVVEGVASALKKEGITLLCGSFFIVSEWLILSNSN